jgi:hypothetical protein
VTVVGRATVGDGLAEPVLPIAACKAAYRKKRPRSNLPRKEYPRMKPPTCGLRRAPVGLSGGRATVTGKELKRALERLEVSQLGAGRLLGVDGRTVRAWIADAARIPESVAILVRLLAAGKIAIADIEAAKTPSKRRPK